MTQDLPTPTTHDEEKCYEWKLRVWADVAYLCESMELTFLYTHPHESTTSQKERERRKLI